MIDFLTRIIYEGHLSSWIDYIFGFIERNPLSVMSGVLLVSFVLYLLRRALFGG